MEHTVVWKLRPGDMIVMRSFDGAIARVSLVIAITHVGRKYDRVTVVNDHGVESWKLHSGDQYEVIRH